MRYNLSNALRAIKNPRLIIYETNRIGIKINSIYHSSFSNHTGTNITDEEWDDLIILDGCRYDLFSEVCEIDVDLETRRSKGSQSWEFLSNNFLNKELHDTIYITANPYAYRLDKDIFYKIENLLESYWDPDIKTVHPEEVTRKAKQIHDNYPDKRLIIHFMQPHFPFIGEKGRQLEQGGISQNGVGEDNNGVGQIWNLVNHPRFDIHHTEVVEAYRENLELVLPYAEELAEYTSGMSVITSDHGNLVGERTYPIPVTGYGHPPGLYLEGLIKVPWLEIKQGTRRSVSEDTPEENEQLDNEIAERRLRDLGYK